MSGGGTAVALGASRETGGWRPALRSRVAWWALPLGCAALAMLTTCGAIDAAKLCRDTAALRCDKLYSCLSDAELAPFKPTLGNDAGECTSRLQLLCGQSGPCKVDEAYHADQASQCKAAWADMTCAQLKASMGVDPAACTATCTR